MRAISSASKIQRRATCSNAEWGTPLSGEWFRARTGGVKWNTSPLTLQWHYHHMTMIERLRASGVKWAHDAADPNAPIIWVAAGGFTPEFEAAVRSERKDVYLWNLADLYR